MKIVEFPEQTTIIAKDQPPYMPLPVHRFQFDNEGRIACCWKLTFWERLKVLWTGVIWHQILTFNQPLQPQLITIDKPDMPHVPRADLMRDIPWEKTAICLIAMLLTGCANLGEMISKPPPDPAVVQAEDTADRAEISVNRFLKYQKASQRGSIPDPYQKTLARSYEESFKTEVDTLRRLAKLFDGNPDLHNALVVQTAKVKASGDTASGQLGPPLNPNRGDTFAPPMPSGDSVLVSLGEIRTQLIELNAKAARGLALQTSPVQRLPPAIIVTNTITVTNMIHVPSTSTNAPPATNAIPPRL